MMARGYRYAAKPGMASDNRLYWLVVGYLVIGVLIELLIYDADPASVLTWVRALFWLWIAAFHLTAVVLSLWLYVIFLLILVVILRATIHQLRRR